MKLDELLRSATQPQHQRLHQVVDLSQMTESPENYAAALGAYWKAVAPLELALSKQFALGNDELLPPDLPLRLTKHAWLQQDLAYLGISREVSLPSSVPILASLNDASDLLPWLAGCGYVMEGMTLGATRIAKLVQDTLGFQEETGARFFAGYGGQTGPMWQAYRQWLAEAELNADITVEAAQRTFSHFEEQLANWPSLSRGTSQHA